MPALFGAWAGRIAEAAGIRRGDQVLDVACGTGVLARELLARVGPDGFVAGLDLDPGMLELAAELAPGIEWRQGSAESLPWPDARFDAVVSQFGLMFFPDRVAALREMHRVVKRGGRISVAVWAALESAPAYAAEVALLQRLAGDRVADALRAPFALGDAAHLRTLLADAGISATITTYVGVARFPDVRSMVEADLRGWLPLMGVALGEEQIEETLREAERALRAFVTPNGEMRFEVAAHVARATKM
ncbi:MAG TPA: methyltransferase domain-containing protein [Myxococcota bacterium]|nr:methyltransferase domain-containing protein [Myxococcota bacterium]